LNLQAYAEITPAIRTWKAYPAYKGSAVEWLGRVPAYWGTKKVKRLCLVKRGASPRPIEDPTYFDDDGEYSWVRISDVTASTKYLERTEQRLSEHGKSKSVPLQPGELFLSIAATVGKPIITKIKCCIHDGFVYFVGLKENREYLFYLFSSGELYKGIGKTGTQLNLNTDTIGDIRIPLPSSAEQQAIVAFLDRETAKIDALVAKKKRLIELLQEKRAAVITCAVTKGLDATVPMKDSGLDWLGEIPAHWELAPVYARYKVTLGKMLDAKRVTGTHLAPYLRNVDVQWDRVNLENLPEMDFHPHEREWYRLRRGDLLVCEGGEVGRTAMWREDLDDCFYQKAIHRVRPVSDKDVSRYFYYVMYAAAKTGTFVAGGNPNTIDHLTAVQLRRYRFPFPPRPEQASIVTFLDEETSKADALVAKIHEGIENLKEYRTALISAAVTGKIDVRGETSI
jgi:type I restriction enzyme S subunit